MKKIKRIKIYSGLLFSFFSLTAKIQLKPRKISIAERLNRLESRIRKLEKRIESLEIPEISIQN